MNFQQKIPAKRDAATHDVRAQKTLAGVSALFFLIAVIEFALKTAPILYILALTFSAIILAGSFAIRLGVGREIVVACILVFTSVEAAVGLFALGGLNSPYILMIILLPILSLFSLNPRTIALAGGITFLLIWGLFAVNDVFFAHLASPERPVLLMASIASLTVAAVTWIFANLARAVNERSDAAVTAVRRELEAAKYSSIAKMAGCIAHEIANPLAILKGHVQVAISSAQAGRADDSASRLVSVERNSSRLERLIKILASMGDPDRVNGPDPVAFTGIISDALTLLSSTLEKTGVRIDQHVPESPEKAWMTGNRALITSILFELIHASILVAKDSVDKTVRLEAQRTNHHITVTITTHHHLSSEDIDRLTRSLNVSLMQILTSSMGGKLSVTQELTAYVQKMDLQLARSSI